MTEHRAIWLQPRCVGDSCDDDRLWSQDDAWGSCEECGLPAVKYIIATEHDALLRALEAIIAEDAEFRESIRPLGIDPIRNAIEAARAILEKAKP